jgi:GDPmannose 4,6-dehydratase
VDQPLLTGEFNSQGVTRVLEAIRQVDPGIRLYQASSSEMYGRVREVPQTELTTLLPSQSLTACRKVFAHYITVNYRESYGMFACSGILFNHESPRRGLEFVTRKVTDGAARIKLGLAISSSSATSMRVVTGASPATYVRAMWLMLQQNEADDYVIATGVSHSVRKLAETAFGHAGLGLAAVRADRPRSHAARRSRSSDWRRIERDASALGGRHRSHLNS